MGSPPPCPCAFGASKQGRSGASGRGGRVCRMLHSECSIWRTRPRGPGKARAQGKHGCLASLNPADAVHCRGEGAVACRVRARPQTAREIGPGSLLCPRWPGEDTRARVRAKVAAHRLAPHALAKTDQAHPTRCTHHSIKHAHRCDDMSAVPPAELLRTQDSWDVTDR